MLQSNQAENQIDQFAQTIKQQIGHMPTIIKERIRNKNVENLQQIIDTENITISDQLFKRQKLFELFCKKLLWKNSQYNNFIYFMDKLEKYKEIFWPQNIIKLYQRYLNNNNITSTSEQTDLDFIEYLFEFKNLAYSFVIQNDYYCLFLILYLKTKMQQYDDENIQQLQIMIPKNPDLKLIYQNRNTKEWQYKPVTFKFYSLDLVLKMFATNDIIYKVSWKDDFSKERYLNTLQKKLYHICKQLHDRLLNHLYEQYYQDAYEDENDSQSQDEQLINEYKQQSKKIINRQINDIMYEIDHSAKIHQYHRLCKKDKSYYFQLKQLENGDENIPLIKFIYDKFVKEHIKQIEQCRDMYDEIYSDIKIDEESNLIKSINEFIQNEEQQIDKQYSKKDTLTNDDLTCSYNQNKIYKSIFYIYSACITVILTENLAVCIETINKLINMINNEQNKQKLQQLFITIISQRYQLQNIHNYDLVSFYKYCYDYKIKQFKQKEEDYKQQDIYKYYFITYTQIKNQFTTDYICNELKIDKNDHDKIQYLNTMKGDYQELYDQVYNLFIDYINQFRNKTSYIQEYTFLKDKKYYQACEQFIKSNNINDVYNIVDINDVSRRMDYKQEE